MLTSAGRHTYSDSDHREFREQLTELLPALKAFARSLTGNMTDAEDLLQDALEKAITAIEQFQPGTNLKAWMFTVMRNAFYSWKRRSWRESLVEPDVFERILTSGRPEAPGHLEWQDALMFIPCLPPEQRDALIAVGYLQLDYEMAAEILGTVVGTMKSRVSRARTLLEEYLVTSTPQLSHETIEELRTATRGIPRTHPLYRIAEAYEELYAGFVIPAKYLVPSRGKKIAPVHYVREPEEAIELEEGADLELTELMQLDPSDF